MTQRFKTTGLLGECAIAAAMVCLGSLTASAQGVPLYQNFGVKNFPPATQIDAVRVENLGTITAAGFPLWDTQNTLHFINSGQMTSTPGFRFDYQPWNTATRYPLMGFTNSGQIFSTQELLISATNLNNFNGLLSSGRDGRTVLESSGTMNLFNSRVRSGDGGDLSNPSEGSLFFVAGNARPVGYLNPETVVDEYWAGRTPNNLLSLPSMAFGGFGGSSSYTVTNRGGIRSSEFLSVYPPVDTNFPSIPGYSFFVYTNLQPHDLGVNPRIWRMTVQGVFIQTNLLNSPEIRVYFHSAQDFSDFTPANVAVEFGLNEVDDVSGQTMSRYLLLNDRTATNLSGAAIAGSNVMMQNQKYLSTFRPADYDVERNDFPLFFFPGNETPASVLDPNLFFYFPNLVTTNVGARFQTNRVPYFFNAYQFSIRPRNLPDGSISGYDTLTGDPVIDQLDDATNSSGTVEIRANNLDLGNASIRADNTINIRATNILDMTGTRFNAQHVNINIPSTNGALVLSNTFPNTVARLNGQVSVWSGLWQINQLITNSAFAGVTNITGTVGLGGSNQVECLYHVMVVSLDNFVLNSQGNSAFFFRSTQLTTNQSADLPRLNVNVPMVELHDTNTFTREFYMGGDCFVVGTNGVFTMTDGLQTFTVDNAPKLTCFTNAGLFTVPQQASFGYDRFDASNNPLPYSNIVNYGTMTAGSLQFRAANFLNASNLFASGGSLFIDATSNWFGGSAFATLRGVLSGSQLVTSNSTLSVGGDLQLSYTDLLTDGGNTNNWSVGGGITVDTRPLKGDLLATRLYLSAPTNLNRTIIWAGQDRGDDPSGYNNNLALQELVLDGSSGSVFRFRGATAANALYINTLTFTNNTTNYATAMAVDSNIKVYFANANIPPDKLTNAFPGRFIWVSTNTAAGPMLSIKSSLAGRVAMASTAYQSLLAGNPDVDGDGIPNDLDNTPISGFTVDDVRVINLPPRTAVITWQGVAGWVYTLESRDSLDAPYWTKLKSVIPSQTGSVTELDSLPPDGQRFYRVRFTRP